MKVNVMDDPILAAELIKLSEELESEIEACRDQLTKEKKWSLVLPKHRIDLRWAGRDLEVDTLNHGETVPSTRAYPTLWLNNHLYFEGGSVQEIAKIIVGIKPA